MAANGWKAVIAVRLLICDHICVHPFPPLPDLQFFVGKELQQICLGFWQFQFQFEAGHISVEGTLEHVDETGAVRRNNTDADRLSPLHIHHLLGQKIQTVAVEPLCLTLAFERGDILRIFS